MTSVAPVLNILNDIKKIKTYLVCVLLSHCLKIRLLLSNTFFIVVARWMVHFCFLMCPTSLSLSLSSCDRQSNKLLSSSQFRWIATVAPLEVTQSQSNRIFFHCVDDALGTFRDFSFLSAITSNTVHFNTHTATHGHLLTTCLLRGLVKVMVMFRKPCIPEKYRLIRCKYSTVRLSLKPRKLEIINRYYIFIIWVLVADAQSQRSKWNAFFAWKRSMLPRGRCIVTIVKRYCMALDVQHAEYVYFQA